MGEAPAPRRFYINKFLSDEFVRRLKTGLIPWRRPWIGQVPLQNGVSGHRYQGLNVFQLTVASIENDFRQPYWLTRNQVHKRGGELLPEHRQKGTLFVFYKDQPIRESIRSEDPETGETVEEQVERTVPLIRYGALFNVAQSTLTLVDLPAYRAVQANGLPRRQAPDAAQAVWELLERSPALPVGIITSKAATAAVYDPLERVIITPPPAKLDDGAAFAFGLFKAVVSATAEPERLDRLADASPSAFREDLVAELGAGLLCGKAGIRPPQGVSQASAQRP